MNLKILSLNAHSLHGEDRRQNTEALCDFLKKERPDVIALQEVNQSADGEVADTDHTELYRTAVTCTRPEPVKEDNFALELYWEMARRGVCYHFCWLPVKLGYGRFDEGLSFLCREPIRQACGFYISKTRSYENWKTRMALYAELKESGLYLCNVHTSRYDDEDEPFFEQWKRLDGRLPRKERLFLMGDFNNPAEIRGEGYDRIAESRYYDLYKLADERRGGISTVSGEIDGWRDGKAPEGGGRIDLILSGFYPKAKNIIYSRVLDGSRGDVVSDHYGIMVNIEGLELDAL